MSNVICPTENCDRTRRGDQHICGACSDQLARDLRTIPELVEDLDLTLSRQTAMGSSGSGGDKPLPYNTSASDAGSLLRDTLTAWVKDLLDGRHDWAPPEPTIPAMAVWLADRHSHLIRHPAVTDIVEEIAAAVEAAGRVVDRPAERQYAGPCPEPDCGEGLYAKPSAVVVTCWGCGTVHRMGERRDFLIAELRGTLATASQCAHILTQLLDNGSVLRPSTVRNWALRGRILVRGHDQQGRPLYLVADCEERFVAELQRQAARGAKVAS